MSTSRYTLTVAPDGVMDVRERGARRVRLNCQLWWSAREPIQYEIPIHYVGTGGRAGCSFLGPAKNRSGTDDLSRSVCYEQQGTEMVCRARGAAGRSKCTPLANFCARIVSDVVLDDGISEQRIFGLEAEVGGEKVALMLPAAEFGRMSWVLRQLGPRAIIYPGQQQHVRAAIQALSKQIHPQRRFTHLGWRKHGAHWIYLQGGGAIGAAGNWDACQVQLPLACGATSCPCPRRERTACAPCRPACGFWM